MNDLEELDVSPAEPRQSLPEFALYLLLRLPSSSMRVPPEVIAEVIRFIDSVPVFCHLLILCKRLTSYIAFEDPTCASHLIFSIGFREDRVVEPGWDLMEDEADISFGSFCLQLENRPNILSKSPVTRIYRFVSRLQVRPRVISETFFYRDLFACFPNLHWLEIFRADSLNEDDLCSLHSSLIHLHLREADSIVSLERFFSIQGRSLRVLSLSGCTMLQRDGFDQLSQLEKLYVGRTPALRLLQSDLQIWSDSLTKLVVSSQSGRQDLVFECPDKGLGIFSRLEVAEFCDVYAWIPVTMFEGIPSSLRRLSIKSCYGMSDDFEIRAIVGEDRIQSDEFEYSFVPDMQADLDAGMMMIDDF